jgi:cytochrome bd-type quinol oxidase subunit 2
MVAWLLLLIAQSGLVATGRTRLHRRLGLVSFALAPAMYVMMIAAWIVTYRHAPESGRTHAANMTIVAINIATMFAVFYTWAMLTRRTAPETHKRMIVLATVVLLSAAVGRMRWLPWNNTPVERFNYAVFAYVLVLLAPAVLHDIVRLGRVHRAYAIGVPLMTSWNVAASLLWDSPWWQRLAPVLFRVHQH